MIYVVGICLGAKLLARRFNHLAKKAMEEDTKSFIKISKTPSGDSVIAKVVHQSI